MVLPNESRSGAMPSDSHSVISAVLARDRRYANCGGGAGAGVRHGCRRRPGTMKQLVPPIPITYTVVQRWKLPSGPMGPSQLPPLPHM
jgi:hypothetical protein